MVQSNKSIVKKTDILELKIFLNFSLLEIALWKLNQEKLYSLW